MTRRAQFPILALIFAALFLRVLVPVGWMPAPAHGAFAIEPCPSADALPTMHMLSSSPGRHHDHGGIGGDCFASMLAAAGLPTGAVQLAVPAPAVVVLTAAYGSTSMIRGPPALPPPSTGPPAIA
jgi:hypothetical protein